MAYIYVLLAVIGYAAQFCLIKLYQSRTVNSSMKNTMVAEKSYFFAMIRSAVTCLIFFSINHFKLDFTVFSVIIALLMMLLTASSSILGILTLSRGKISVYTLFMMLGGMLLPFLAGVIFWGEPISALRILGLILLTASLYTNVLEKREEKNTNIFYILCVCIFLINGLFSIISKYHQITPGHVDTLSFVILCDLFNAPFAAALWLFFRLKLRNSGEQCLELKDKKRFVEINLLIIALYALISGAAFMLNLMCAATLDASILYPMITGGTIFFTAVAGFIVFREKPGKYSSLGIVIAVIATVLFLG